MLLLIGQLSEIVTILLLLLVFTILIRFGGIKYIRNLRIAFLSYFILIIITVLDPFNQAGLIDGFTKYALLAYTSVFIYLTFSDKLRTTSARLIYYLPVVTICLAPLILILTDNAELLEGAGYVVFGFALIYLGISWYRYVLKHVMGSKIVAITFVLLGLHMMDFIIFQYDELTLTIGYLIAAGFEATITILLVFLNFAHLKEMDEINYQKYMNLFYNSSDAILLINNETIFECNGQAETMFETTKEKIIGLTPMDLSVSIQENGRDSFEYGAELFSSASRGQVTRFDWTHKSVNGRKIICEISLFVLEDDQFAAIIRDMSSAYAYEEEINFHKYYDAITHLPKRELFIDRLTRFLEERYRSVALIAFNIDNFKEINDEYGHEAGDELLRQVANRVLSAFKTEITITRLGGDEFVVIMDKLVHKNRIYLPIEKIQNSFVETFDLYGHAVMVSICLGVAFPDGKDVQPMELLKNADLALNLAKAKGRGRLEFYSETEKAVFANRINVERDMRIGIEQGEFIPYYQPIINPHNNQVIGVEALARWIKKDGSMVYPDVFIPIAEETELIKDIGRQILSIACKECKEIIDQKPGFVVHVNLSPLQLKDNQIVQVLRSVMEEHEVTARHIAVELTEAVFIEDVSRTNGILKLIRDMGIGVALDDFGTGYSSLSYLAEMQVDTIKIDRSFVVKLPNDPKSRAMIEYLNELLHKLGYKIVVEGVEEQDQAEYLIGLGCDAIQGYYYHRPMTRDELGKLMDE